MRFELGGARDGQRLVAIPRRQARVFERNLRTAHRVGPAGERRTARSLEVGNRNAVANRAAMFHIQARGRRIGSIRHRIRARRAARIAFRVHERDRIGILGERGLVLGIVQHAIAIGLHRQRAVFGNRAICIACIRDVLVVAVILCPAREMIPGLRRGLHIVAGDSIFVFDLVDLNAVTAHRAVAVGRNLDIRCLGYIRGLVHRIQRGNGELARFGFQLESGQAVARHARPLVESVVRDRFRTSRNRRLRIRPAAHGRERGIGFVSTCSMIAIQERDILLAFLPLRRQRVAGAGGFTVERPVRIARLHVIENLAVGQVLDPPAGELVTVFGFEVAQVGNLACRLVCQRDLRHIVRRRRQHRAVEDGLGEQAAERRLGMIALHVRHRLHLGVCRNEHHVAHHGVARRVNRRVAFVIRAHIPADRGPVANRLACLRLVRIRVLRRMACSYLLGRRRTRIDLPSAVVRSGRIHGVGDRERANLQGQVHDRVARHRNLPSRIARGASAILRRVLPSALQAAVTGGCSRHSSEFVRLARLHRHARGIGRVLSGIAIFQAAERIRHRVVLDIVVKRHFLHGAGSRCDGRGSCLRRVIAVALVRVGHHAARCAHRYLAAASLGVVTARQALNFDACISPQRVLVVCLRARLVIARALGLLVIALNLVLHTHRCVRSTQHRVGTDSVVTRARGDDICNGAIGRPALELVAGPRGIQAGSRGIQVERCRREAVQRLRLRFRPCGRRTSFGPATHREGAVASRIGQRHRTGNARRHRDDGAIGLGFRRQGSTRNIASEHVARTGGPALDDSTRVGGDCGCFGCVKVACCAVSHADSRFRNFVIRRVKPLHREGIRLPNAP